MKLRNWMMLFALGFSLQAVAATNGTATPADAAANSLKPSNGQMRCVAAMNSDGSVAAGDWINVDRANTTHLGTGQYQVAFKPICGGGSITAANGFARLVQVDTLTTGTAGMINCTTADRYGVANAVWVQCTDNTGALADTSFFLFLMR